MRRTGKDGGTFVRWGLGCLAYLVVYALVAAAVDRWTAPRVVADARPWLGAVAGAFFTLTFATLWGLALGSGRGDDSRAAILGRASAGTLPDRDGLIVATGTVRAATVPLQSPLSGTTCVAYSYRMYYKARDARNRRVDVPVFWGQACRPFFIDTAAHALRVMAVPRLGDAVTPCTAPEQVERARQYVGATRFDEASGLIGAVGTAFTTVNAMFTDDDGESRFDWRRAGETRDPATLLLEETVLPVGTTASVSGPWSVERHAIVPTSTPFGTPGVTVASGPVEALLRADGQIPPGPANVVVHAVVFAALGCVILWAGLRIFAPA